ncbi:hypothetical protein SS50377_27878 [Spironucleus salmonicida]|uniref:Uncharacterized protein n=1 Tax=Spironucleus salmonicida TaxID=348837 RepID=V6LW00_9EUKA|nr:hypothetical protein SS50377_27878 [Spironucleus salmonicida]|eukprot:EST48807.1 Hypothetical protein SS50377_10902 [Spironucleus salmonicida]
MKPIDTTFARYHNGNKFVRVGMDYIFDKSSVTQFIIQLTSLRDLRLFHEFVLELKQLRHVQHRFIVLQRFSFNSKCVSELWDNQGILLANLGFGVISKLFATYAEDLKHEVQTTTQFCYYSCFPAHDYAARDSQLTLHEISPLTTTVSLTQYALGCTDVLTHFLPLSLALSACALFAPFLIALQWHNSRNTLDKLRDLDDQNNLNTSDSQNNAQTIQNLRNAQNIQKLHDILLHSSRLYNEPNYHSYSQFTLYCLENALHIPLHFFDHLGPIDAGEHFSQPSNSTSDPAPPLPPLLRKRLFALSFLFKAEHFAISAALQDTQNGVLAAPSKSGKSTALLTTYYFLKLSGIAVPLYINGDPRREISSISANICLFPLKKSMDVRNCRENIQHFMRETKSYYITLKNCKAQIRAAMRQNSANPVTGHEIFFLPFANKHIVNVQVIFQSLLRQCGVQEGGNGGNNDNNDNNDNKSKTPEIAFQCLLNDDFDQFQALENVTIDDFRSHPPNNCNPQDLCSPHGRNCQKSLSEQARIWQGSKTSKSAACVLLSDEALRSAKRDFRETVHFVHGLVEQYYTLLAASKQSLLQFSSAPWPGLLDLIVYQSPAMANIRRRTSVQEAFRRACGPFLDSNDEKTVKSCLFGFVLALFNPRSIECIFWRNLSLSGFGFLEFQGESYIQRIYGEYFEGQNGQFGEFSGEMIEQFQVKSIFAGTDMVMYDFIAENEYTRGILFSEIFEQYTHATLCGLPQLHPSLVKNQYLANSLLSQSVSAGKILLNSQLKKQIMDSLLHFDLYVLYISVLPEYIKNSQFYCPLISPQLYILDTRASAQQLNFEKIKYSYNLVKSYQVENKMIQFQKYDNYFQNQFKIVVTEVSDNQACSTKRNYYLGNTEIINLKIISSSSSVVNMHAVFYYNYQIVQKFLTQLEQISSNSCLQQQQYQLLYYYFKEQEIQEINYLIYFILSITSNIQTKIFESLFKFFKVSQLKLCYATTVIQNVNIQLSNDEFSLLLHGEKELRDVQFLFLQQPFDEIICDKQYATNAIILQQAINTSKQAYEFFKLYMSNYKLKLIIIIVTDIEQLNNLVQLKEKRSDFIITFHGIQFEYINKYINTYDDVKYLYYESGSHDHVELLQKSQNKTIVQVGQKIGTVIYTNLQKTVQIKSYQEINLTFLFYINSYLQFNLANISDKNSEFITPIVSSQQLQITEQGKLQSNQKYINFQFKNINYNLYFDLAIYQKQVYLDVKSQYLFFKANDNENIDKYLTTLFDYSFVKKPNYYNLKLKQQLENKLIKIFDTNVKLIQTKENLATIDFSYFLSSIFRVFDHHCLYIECATIIDVKYFQLFCSKFDYQIQIAQDIYIKITNYSVTIIEKFIDFGIILMNFQDHSNNQFKCISKDNYFITFPFYFQNMQQLLCLNHFEITISESCYEDYSFTLLNQNKTSSASWQKFEFHCYFYTLQASLLQLHKDNKLKYIYQHQNSPLKICLDDLLEEIFTCNSIVYKIQDDVIQLVNLNPQIGKLININSNIIHSFSKSEKIYLNLLKNSKFNSLPQKDVQFLLFLSIREQFIEIKKLLLKTPNFLNKSKFTYRFYYTGTFQNIDQQVYFGLNEQFIISYDISSANLLTLFSTLKAVALTIECYVDRKITVEFVKMCFFK